MSFTDNSVLSNGRFAGLVKRYHCWPMSQVQDIASHSWQMYRIYRKLWGPPSPSTTEYIMFHDVGELFSGDAALYAKRDIPGLKPLLDKAEIEGAIKQGLDVPKPVPSETWRVKACDLLEGLEHCLLDVQMGNQLAIPAANNYIEGLDKHLSSPIPSVSDKRTVELFLKLLYENHELVLNARPVAP